MAEARQAVGFRLGLTPDGGLHFEYDHDVFDLMARAMVRTWTKRVAHALTGVKTGIFPVKIELFGANIALLTALHLAGIDPLLGFTHYLFWWLDVTEGVFWVLSCILAAILTSLLWTGLVRFSLRILFSYQGWMFMSREEVKKNPSVRFRCWTMAVKLISSLRRLGSSTKSGNPLLLAYQGALPTMPLPSVSDTLRRHMDSIRPLVDDEEYAEFKVLSDEFETDIGYKLQRWLRLKWWTSDNYVSDWWEEYVYLRGRSPLMINSNYYVIDAILKYPTHIQAARAANVVNLSFQFRRSLLKQEATPMILQHLIPMCSAQYERFFNTTRVPGVETDQLVHLADSTHVAVLHKGRFFRLCCYSKGRLLNSAELQRQIQGILDDPVEPSEGESHLAVMTAANRTTWAETRQKYFSKGVNKSSLDVIEKAAFVLVLDDYEYGYDPNDASVLSNFGAMMLHGKCHDRWFDKSIQLIVGSNGRLGANGEHSWADAPIVGHFWEYLVCHDVHKGSYDEVGHCIGEVLTPPPKARKLCWEIPQECQATIDTCLREAQSLADDLHLHILKHDAFGKGFMKSCGLSPDAFIQMGLQLAYYRDAGKFSLTYEASMTRLFREGRTETVRPCTIESSEWVQAMEKPDIPNKEKIALLDRACKKHVLGYQEAMTGMGIDRHLFAMYVVSKYLDIESRFLQRVISEPWRLSTSQTPVRGEYLDVKIHPELISAGGGFGPVADDGYGVSYIITGEDNIFFHVSCKRKSPKTDATKFASGIAKALADIQGLYQSKPATAFQNGTSVKSEE